MTLVWLASYPKSGSTWLRIFLTNYRTPTGDGWSLKDRLRGNMAHLERHRFDEEMGIASGDIPANLLDGFRRRYHAIYASKFGQPSFAKVHEAFAGSGDGKSMYATGAKSKAVYILRNPLAVAPSYAHHLDRPVDEIINRMADGSATMRYGDGNFGEYLGDWSSHVASWASQSAIKTLVLRYEDFASDPKGNFAQLVEFCGLGLDERKLERAIRASNFSVLRKAESENGFTERPVTSCRFFRKGKNDGWRDELTDIQIERIRADHGSIMKRFGYL